MSLILNSIDEYFESNIEIPKKEYINIKIKKEYLDFNVIMQYAKCEVFKGVHMELDNVVEIFFEGINLINNSIFIPKEMLDYYLNLLNECVLEKDVLYIYLLMKNQLKVGYRVVFKNEKKGQILSFKDSETGQLYYKLVKKDGTLGSRNNILYGLSDNYKYKCSDRDFVDFSYIKIK